jgi:hypothetical protein
MKWTTLFLLSAFAAADQPAETQWSSGAARIQLLETRQGEWAEYIFEIREDGAPTRRSALKSKPLTIDRAWLGPVGQFLVVGRSGSQAVHLLIGQPGSDGNEWIRTWRNAISPSGRLYALQTFVPAHGEELPDSVTIYDLGKSPEENSLTDEKVPAYFWPRDCTGRLVYPEKNAFAKSCKIEPGEKIRRLVSPFLWKKDEIAEYLYFLTMEENELYLIRTSLPDAKAPVVVWRQAIDLRSRYSPDPNNDLNFKKGVKFWADRLSWTPDGKILVELDPIYGFGSSFELDPG